MLIHKLNFKPFEGLRDYMTKLQEEAVFLILPDNSNLFRIYKIPMKHRKSVLDILCHNSTRRRHGVWYLNLEQAKKVAFELHVGYGFDVSFATPDEESAN